MARPSLTRMRLLVVVGAVAAALAAGLVVASQLGARGGASNPSVAVAGAAATSALLAGIPQQGAVLGDPHAPVTLVEYADLQCPYCGIWARETFPELVRDYVRTGRVRLVFRGLAFVGPDSDRALRIALAAGAQDRLWHVVELLYANQGEENAGWVSDALLRRLGERVPSLDVGRMLAQRGSPAVEQAMARDERLAAEAGVRATPSFLIARTGAPLRPLEPRSLDAAAFRPALDALLAR